METDQVLTPKQISRMEHILPIWAFSQSLKNSKLIYKRVHLGVRVSSLNHPELTDLLRNAGSHYKKAEYLLVETKGTINVIVHKHSTAADVLQSFVHAHVMASLMDKSRSVHTESQSWIDKQYEIFLQKLKSLGWKTERLLSPSITWKANWISGPVGDKID